MTKNLFPAVLSIFLFSSSLLFSQDRYHEDLQNYVSTEIGSTFIKKDLKNFVIDNVDHSQSMNGDVIKLQQVYKNIPIYNGVATAFYKDGKVLHYADNFAKDYNQISSDNPLLTKEIAFNTIFENSSVSGNAASYTILDFNNHTNENLQVAKQRLIYFKKENNILLCYEFIFEEMNSPNLWNILVDANSGEIILKNNLTLFCNFNDEQIDPSDKHFNKTSNFSLGEDHQIANSLIKSADNASYFVWEFPLESPIFGNRTLATNPWILSSSPDGWHYDGTNHYTTTRGNNVHSYENHDMTNNPGTSPDGSSQRIFNFPYDADSGYLANQNASITQLFYGSNKVHDIFYKLGFTETARNFQQQNYGLGGVGNDYVTAEAQDLYAYNNANFSTGPDGWKGKMQTYLWDPPYRQHLFYNIPTSATSRIVNSKAGGPYAALTAVGVTGDIAIPSIIDACTALPANSLTGKIALIERSPTCSYLIQIKNAQNAGAIGVIIYNSSYYTNFLQDLQIYDQTITIPSVAITFAEGEFIRSSLLNGISVNVVLKDDPTLTPHPDSAFDNGLIIHEYGHGISNRNSGNGYSCLNGSVEQMGEGWSDFFLLMLTNNINAHQSDPRGIGMYLINQSFIGQGIRDFKYSTNILQNPDVYGDFSFRDTHDIGAIWANILWDLHWKYAEKYGFSSDVTANNYNGSTRVLQLVIDGLKLQECEPTFITGRDAILAAELITTGGTDRCMIWKSFAKRGVGVNASAGNKLLKNDQVADYTIPAECNLGTSENENLESSFVLYPNPAKTRFQISTSKRNIMGNVKVEIFDTTGRLISSYHKLDFRNNNSFDISSFSTGVYFVKVSGLGFTETMKLIKE